MDFTPPIDPLYIAARRVLLDAVDALADHQNSLVVVGAQAVYLHAADADLDAAIAPFTTDADLALDPFKVGQEPKVVDAMSSAGFHLKIKSGGGTEPGSWLREIQVEGKVKLVPVDLIVPGALAVGRGRRDARLPDHGPQYEHQDPYQVQRRWGCDPTDALRSCAARDWRQAGGAW